MADQFIQWDKVEGYVVYNTVKGLVQKLVKFSDISAYPDSVNVLEKINSDVRTPDKLIDGVNDTTDGGHMWLAPILPSIVSLLLPSFFRITARLFPIFFVYFVL